MNPRIAEQLLYESEATLRLVDTLLDELQVREPRLRLLQIDDLTGLLAPDRGDHTIHVDTFEIR